MPANRIIRLGWCLLWIFPLLSGRAGASDTLSRSDRRLVTERAPIVFICETVYPPYETLDDAGRPTGISVELAAWIAAEYGFEALFANADFMSAQETVLSGKADVLMGMFYSERRDRDFAFTEPICTVPASLFVLNERTDIRQLADLSGKRVAMQDGDYAIEFLASQAIEHERAPARSYGEALDAVASGEADVMLGDEPVVYHLLYSRTLQQRIKKIGPPIYQGLLCMATRETDRPLASILSRGIQAAKRQGELDRLSEKWRGAPMARRESLFFRYTPYLAAAAGAGLVLALSLWIWNLILQRRVAIRTADLRRHEEQMRMIVQSMPVLMYARDREGRFTAWNLECERVTGYAASDMRSEARAATLLYPDADYRRRMTDELKRRAGDYRDFEIEITCKDGAKKIIAWSDVSKRHPIPGWESWGVGVDVTARRRAELKLRQSEEMYRTIFNFAPAAVVLLNELGVLVDFNDELCGIAGSPREKLLGLNLLELIRNEPLKQALRDALAGRSSIYEGDYQAVLTGKVTPIRVLIQPIRMDDGHSSGVVGLVEDITERRQAEEMQRRIETQIQQTQKLESLGVLAGGIAHDFNNLLVGILGNAGLALDAMPPTMPARIHLVEIETAAKRAADLCRQMLAYSGKGRFQVEAIHLNTVVEEMAHLVKIFVSKSAILRFNLADNLPPVQADVTQIRQIVMNLVTNAAEAIGNRSGVISVVTGAAEYSRSDLAECWMNENLPEGLYAYMEVADTGCGMDRATLARIFDPFFSTKFTGRGLGLAAVLGIVRGHRGAIRIQTEPGKGSAFRILLPAAPDAVVRTMKDAEPLPDWRGSGDILLVDDEETVRTVTRRILEYIGFEVLTAEDGRGAIEAFKKNADSIRCVILDLTMPHMNGEEAFRELRRLHAKVPIILCSGYAELEVKQQFASAGLTFNGFIQKPYQFSTMVQSVKNALAGN